MQHQRWQPTRLPHPWDSSGKNTGVGCHFLLQCMKGRSEREVAQSRPTLRDPMDCSPPGSSVHGIFQARVLEWGAIAFSDTGFREAILKKQINPFLLLRAVLALIGSTTWIHSVAHAVTSSFAPSCILTVAYLLIPSYSFSLSFTCPFPPTHLPTHLLIYPHFSKHFFSNYCMRWLGEGSPFKLTLQMTAYL